MNHTEAAAARDRLEGSQPQHGPATPHEHDIAAVCAWTRHWEHACTELDTLLANEKQRAAQTKSYNPNTQEARK